MSERDDLDRLIDAELSRYAEPRVGLEQRILGRVASEVNRSRLRWLLIAIPVPVAALLLLFSASLFNAPHPQHQAYAPVTKPVPQLQAPILRTAPKLVSSTHARDRKQSQARVLKSVNARPKLDLFPTLHPLSEEEQAIERFGNEAQEEDRRALVEDRQHIDEPVNITAIRIAPLPSLKTDQN
ncbi:hypothetical protein [Occallatibacter savannae]|uniref:hypothetical protein n=1 Tax=Occallatibacter savannae TaxID=1002691 RepID=UPI000D69C7EC|nr:hypothetical protein [Occallatibacter savannae]